MASRRPTRVGLAVGPRRRAIKWDMWYVEPSPAATVVSWLDIRDEHTRLPRLGLGAYGVHLSIMWPVPAANHNLKKEKKNTLKENSGLILERRNIV